MSFYSGSIRVVALAALLVAGGPVRAVVINVPADQPTMAAAIAVAAPSGDEIVVAPGLYLQTGTLDTAGKAIVIRSSGGAAVTTIQGSGAAGTRVFIFQRGETAAMVLDGFTITGGTLGAIRIGGTADGQTTDLPPTGNPGASPTIRNCIFENNASASSDGGAITVGMSDPSGFNKGHSTPLIESCIFRNNISTSNLSTARGGAINLSGGAPTIRNCAFTGNSALRAGGAIGIAANTLVVPNLTVRIEGCTFSGNICNPTNASAGGCPGIHIAGRNVDIIDSTISNHTIGASATQAVGALAIVLAGSAAAAPPYTLNLTNTTISNNYCETTAGARYRPVMLVVAPSTVNITGGGLTNNGFRLSDGAELGFNKGIELAPASPDAVTLNISGATFAGNSTSPTTPTGNTALITGRAGATAGSGGIAAANITSTSFSGNEVSAVYFNNGSGPLSITGGSITGNTGGAGMIVANPITSVSIDGTTFSGNSGLISVSGAASGSTGGTFGLDGVTITANTGGVVSAANFATAAVAGGALTSAVTSNTRLVFSGGGDHTVTGTSFTGNQMPGASSPTLLSVTGDAGAGTLAVINCTFANNSASGSSADLISATDLATASISGSMFTGNTLTGPGAVIVSFSSVGAASVTGSTFADQPADAVVFSDSSGTVSGSTFRNNDSGINASSSEPATLTVSNSSFTGGLSNGGTATGISVGDVVAATITACRIIGNADGGIALGGSAAHSVINTLVAGSTGDSGAIRISEAASVTIANCTLVANSPDGGGAGGVTVSDSASATIVNTISYGNTAPEIDASGTIGIVGVSFSNVQGGFAGANNIDLGPTYADPDGADNTPNSLDDDYRLASGSAGINVGSNAGVPDGVTTDLGGNARIVNTTVDIGAFEFQAPSCPADFNNSGFVTVQDIFDFLAAYFAGLSSADFNSSGLVTVQDIFDYLAAYFAGCP